jgi:hypothetical protein
MRLRAVVILSLSPMYVVAREREMSVLSIIWNLKSAILFARCVVVVGRLHLLQTETSRKFSIQNRRYYYLPVVVVGFAFAP